MNIFKNLVIKILCCAIVCAVIMPDVYGMKRKADGQPEGQQDGRNVRPRTDDEQDTSVEVASRSSSANSQETTAPVKVPSDQDGKGSSNSHSGEVKLEAKQAGKTKNIFSMIQGVQLGKKVSNQTLYNWVRNLPDKTEEREKAETIIQLILAHCTTPDFVLLEWFELLPPGREEGNARSRVITLLDKKIKQMVAHLTADMPPILFFVDASIAGLCNGYAERLEKTCKNATEFVNKLPKGYVRTMVQYLLFTEHQIDTPHRCKIYNIVDRTIRRFMGPRDPRCYTAGRVDLSNLRITSFDEIADILAIVDHQEPITHLDLSKNNLTSAPIPTSLKALVSLELSHNKLTTYTGPFYNGFALFLDNNNFSNSLIEQERIRNSCVGSMYVQF